MSRDVMQQVLDAWDNGTVDDMPPIIDRLRAELAKPAAVPEGWEVRKQAGQFVVCQLDAEGVLRSAWIGVDSVLHLYFKALFGEPY